MQNETINRMINPYNGQRLVIEKKYSNTYLVDRSGNRIPVIDGIPDFTVFEDANKFNRQHRRKNQTLKRMAAFMQSLLYNHSELKTAWLKAVKIHPGHKVLEIAAGSRWNFRLLPRLASYYAIDSSRRRLTQAHRYAAKKNLDVQLFQGSAEFLPFADNMFDSVLLPGGINSFRDKKKAIEEMIRVAKPGTKIIIIDQTDKSIRNLFRKTAFIKRYFTSMHSDFERLVTPADLVPPDVRELEIKWLDNGKKYRLSFRV